MNKVYGKKTDYAPVREDYSRIIVSYGMESVTDPDYATWYEVYFYKKQKPTLTKEEIHAAIIDDINAITDERILSGFVWRDMPVWLSMENQFNYKGAYDLAVQTQGASLPVTFKLGEQDGETVYFTFNDMATFTDFYTSALAYKDQCLKDGWTQKDKIDMDDYDWPVARSTN